MARTSAFYPTNTIDSLSPNQGGQFEPAEGGQFEMAEGGQFEMAEGGQFSSAKGGQFEWVFQLIDELKQEKLKVDQWTDKSATAAAVFNTVSTTLFKALPYPTYQTDDIELKTNLVYDHLKRQYFGGGASIYGKY